MERGMGVRSPPLHEGWGAGRVFQGSPFPPLNNFPFLFYPGSRCGWRRDAGGAGSTQERGGGGGRLYWALGEGRGWAAQLQTAKGKTM